MAHWWLLSACIFYIAGCNDATLRDAVWLPEATSVRVSLASQTSLNENGPPVDVEFDATVVSVTNKGAAGVHVVLKNSTGRVDTLVISIADPTTVNLRAGAPVHIRFASKSFGDRDRRAGVALYTLSGELLFLIQDSGLPPRIDLPGPLQVNTDSRITYTVASRNQDYCYRVIEHRAFRVFDGYTNRSIAPGDPHLEYKKDENIYRFIPIEHRVEARSDACTAPLTPRTIWMTYLHQRSPASPDDSVNALERGTSLQ